MSEPLTFYTSKGTQMSTRHTET